MHVKSQRGILIYKGIMAAAERISLVHSPRLNISSRCSYSHIYLYTASIGASSSYSFLTGRHTQCVQTIPCTDMPEALAMHAFLIAKNHDFS